MAEFIILNDGSAEDETALGATEVFASFEQAQSECEHWVSEERGMRFYDRHGERLVAIDHGDWATFHFERAGSFFEGFEDLIRRDGERRGIAEPDTGFSVEHVLRTIWEQDEADRQDRGGCLAWFLPPPSFREKYGFWSWYFPSLRKEPTDI